MAEKSQNSMTIDIRKVTLDDLYQVRKLHVYSTSRSWTDNMPSKEELSFYTPNEIIGVFHGEKLLSMIRDYTFKQSVRGIIKNMGGVSHVATYPEYRLKGYVNRLMGEAFLDMKEKNQSVSLLHPFKESFYEAFDYIGTNDNMLVKIPLSAFDGYLKKMPNIDEKWQEERARAIDVQDEFENFKYTLDLLENHGLVFLNDVTKEYWIQDHMDVIVVFIKKDNKIMAEAKYIKQGSGENGEIYVCEMHWKDIESRFMLFRYFAKHKDQFAHIEMVIPYGANFFQWVKDPTGPFNVRINNCPWMVRIIDAIQAVKDINVTIDGNVILQLEDSKCPWNNGIFNLKAIDNKLEMGKCHEDSPQVEMNIKALTALLYGTCSINELIFKQWIKPIDFKASYLLDQWFPKKVFYNPYYF